MTSEVPQPPAESRQEEPALACPAPAPVPMGGEPLEPEDTWMTFGLGVEGAEDDRTVTVVFSQANDASAEFPGGPFKPVFPDGR